MIEKSDSIEINILSLSVLLISKFKNLINIGLLSILYLLYTHYLIFYE